MKTINFGRRQFLKTTGVVAMGLPFISMASLKGKSIAFVTERNDPVADSAPVRWAVSELKLVLVSNGAKVNHYEKIDEVKADDSVIVMAGSRSSLGTNLLKSAAIDIPAVSEALGLVRLTSVGQKVLLATGFDARGLVYAILEIYDSVRYSGLAILDIEKPVVEKPVNEIRSLNRLFVSDVEDKPWYNDREMWPQYLTLLATQRFNRFSLSFGIGYDFLQKVEDAYFLFAYPFLMSVPGYNVRVPQLPDSERDSNLAMLQFISEQTVARGMQFQLGIWMHGYEWLNTTKANYTIEGLDKTNHAAYCRDALRLLLQMCPAISGITFRVHGESGVNEGSYEFWKTIFDGVKTCGRKVEIDMHAKGLDQSMIDVAVNTGMPTIISPKYWAEHWGMPYHQADIRALEVPSEKQNATGLMSLSAGSRSFLRYGYGDLMKEDRPYKVIHRIWPGTQRLLLWGDPLMASAYSNAFSFCGSAGVELMEFLSFKGRRGSGIAGNRCGYADNSLAPRWDWEKYEYSLRVFGRAMYNPGNSPDVWKRYMKFQFKSTAQLAEEALAAASRILPIVTTAHGASAGNNTYWVEMYTNQPITDPSIKNTYTDTPAPKTFGNVSPHDPQLFLSINDFVKEYLSEERSGKYSPLEVAQWIEDLAAVAASKLKELEVKTGNKTNLVYRRLSIDVSMLIDLGRFFGSKFRAGVLYAVFEQTNNKTALEEALKAYKTARTTWAKLAETAKGVYEPDVTVGENPWLRGHWLDRLPAMDEDIANMAKKLESYTGSSVSNDKIKAVIEEALAKPKRSMVACAHNKPTNFVGGQPINLEFTFEQTPLAATLYYRHVNQGERYRKVGLKWQGRSGAAAIPGEYSNSLYPLEYYLEIKVSENAATICPGFNAELTNQPYWVVRKA